MALQISPEGGELSTVVVAEPAPSRPVALISQLSPPTQQSRPLTVRFVALTRYVTTVPSLGKCGTLNTTDPVVASAVAPGAPTAFSWASARLPESIKAMTARMITLPFFDMLVPPVQIDQVRRRWRPSFKTALPYRPPCANPCRVLPASWGCCMMLELCCCLARLTSFPGRLKPHPSDLHADWSSS